MSTKRILMFGLGCLYGFIVAAQDKINEQKADETSLRLYNEKKWKELVEFGKTTLAGGTDFPLLRMRTGYAAFVLGNYAESLKQYEKVYRDDRENQTALYYVYWNNIYLNNTVSARYYAGKMTEENQEKEQIKSSKLSGLNLEYSFKSPNVAYRGNASYGKLGVNLQLGYRLELQQAVGFYNQVISEPRLLAVTDNRNIKINQKEYYGKLIFAATGKLGIIGGFHYLNTPFNNFTYNNMIGFGGIKMATPFVHLLALGQFGRIRDTSYTQVDAVITTYPIGSTKLYTITRASFGDDFALTQVAGVQVVKKTWLEGNITAGRYKKMLGNDALYIYDDIDTKKLRVGGSLYYLAGKKMMISANYTFEQKVRYGSTNVNFNQYSITGGIQWNF